MATSHATPPPASDVSVMISYSRTDAVFAQRLCEDLKAAGFPTWLDTSIPGGRLWRREIDQAIDDARVVLVVMSPAAMQSTWVRREYKRALRAGKVVIPLDYYPCNIPAPLAERQILSFRPSFVNAEAFYAQQFHELTNALSGLSGYAPYAPYAPLTAPVPPRTVTTTPSPRERLLTGALALSALAGVLLAVLAGYANGALLPAFAQPDASRVSLGGVILFALSLVTLVLQRARRPDGSVNLYLEDHARFLSKVHMRYTHRLKPPFAGALWLTLGLSEAAQAVARPALARQLGPGGEPHLLPAGTTITTAFNDAEGQLLILGAPGAGKSWLLYQLALALVEQAQTDVEKASPVPVVFDLASWAQAQKPLAGWMVDQLTETWQVPPDIARVWVAQHLIFPLLDGLDEVRRDARDACVAAINRYQHDHGLDSLAVCCRKADYDALETRLDLRTAVVVEPLTPEQIDNYLAAGGAPLAALRSLAQSDEQMRDLFSTPLMLSMVALAYEGKAAEAIPAPRDDQKAWTQAVFRDYVPTMLARRLDATGRAGSTNRDLVYSDTETTRYLAWLAAQMREHERPDMFYLEQLQPEWLPTAWARRVWRWQVSLGAWLVLDLTFILGFVLVGWVGFERNSTLGYLLGAVCFAVASGLFLWSALDDDAPTGDISLRASVRVVRPRWRAIRVGLLAGLMAGLTGTLLCTLGATVSTLVSSGLNGEGNTLTGGGFLAMLFLSLVSSLFIGLVLGLSSFVTTTTVDEDDLSLPNQGVALSLRSARIGGLLGGVVGGVLVGLAGLLVGWLYDGLDSALVFGLATALFFSLAFGLFFWLRSGLYGYIRHQTLLWALARRRLIPRHYLDFLDFAADHVLLQRVGGGYRFVHALLLDYFADQWPDLSATPPKGGA